MFQSLTDKISEAFKKFRNKGKLTESDVKEGMREIKLALLEADVNFKVVKEFIKKVEKEYDYIIFDTPPIGIVIDAVPIIQSSDGVVVIVKNNSTTYPDLNKTLDVINRSGGKTLGVIINKIKPSDSKKFHKNYKQENGYYGYYGY